MAQIPVQRKKPQTAGFPGWVVPVGALLLLLPLLLLMMRGCSNNENAGIVANANRDSRNANGAVNATNNNTAIVITNTGSNETADADGNNAQTADSPNTDATDAGAIITDTSYFAGINDKESLAGRQADLKNVRVRRVLSDHLFTVGSGRGEMYAYLGENLDSGGGQEQRIKIRSGQRVDLQGDFRQVPGEETASETQTGGLSEKEANRLKKQKIYLHASGVSEARK